MSYFRAYVETLQSLKNDGVPRCDALGCLEFDSDFYPDQGELDAALEEVYGKEVEVQS